MPTAPSSPKPLTQSQPQDRFTFEKATVRGVTFLTFHGIIDHALEGRKLGSGISTNKIVVNMRDVRRFSSWGMSEWMDFLKITANKDVYIVECSTYSSTQLNLVTGLLGHGKLVSFYAAYICGSCSEEVQTLFVIPRDREIIRDLPGTQQDCTTCGRRSRLEQYPAAFFETIANRPSFDIDDEVLALLRTRYNYDLAPDLTRFRAYRKAHKEHTYIRLSGSMVNLPASTLAAASEGTTVVDLEAVVLDPGGIAAWRGYLPEALARVTSLQLVACPPGFLDQAVQTSDLQDRLKVRTFSALYECPRCNTGTTQLIDVAENLEQLVNGEMPMVRCAICESMMVPVISEEEVARLQALPARDHDPALEAFLAKARTEPYEKLEDCLVARRTTAGAKKSPSTVAIGLGLGGGLVVATAAVAIALWMRPGGEPSSAAAGQTAPVTPPKPQFERPDWIMFDVPSSGYCHDLINRLMCVGVSSYKANRDDGVAEANDAALEELVSAVGLKITTPFFKERIAPAYTEGRTKALGALQAADSDRPGKAYAAALGTVGKARKRVAEILQASGGAAVPAQRSDWYWEQYKAKDGGSEFLVFVRYDVPLDAVKALVDRYSAPAKVLDSTVVTAFPALAWQSASFNGGVELLEVGHTFTSAGAAAHDIVLGVGDHRVADAASLARRLDDWRQGSAADLDITLTTADAAPRVVKLKRH